LSAGNPLRLRENHSGKFVAIRGFFFYLFKNFAALREKKKRSRDSHHGNAKQFTLK